MNKKELIEEVAKVTPTKKEVAAAVYAVLGSITRVLKKGERVTLKGG